MASRDPTGKASYWFINCVLARAQMGYTGPISVDDVCRRSDSLNMLLLISFVSHNNY